MTSGTPPARKTRTVGWSTGPFGSTSTSRGTRAVHAIQSSTVGPRQPGGVGDGGDVQERGSSSRRTRRGPSSRCGRALGVRTSRKRHAARVELDERARRAPRHVEPDRLAGGRQGASAAAPGPSASATTWDVAAVPRNWQPPPGEAQARQPSSAASSSVIEPVGEPRAERLHLARVLALLRRAASRRPARAPPAGPRIPASAIIIAGQALVAGRDAEHARAASAASGSAGGGRSPRRCGTAGCPSSRRCPACGRRRGRCTYAGERQAPSRSQLLGGGLAPAGRPPSGRCDSPARSAGRPARAARPAC